MREILFRGKRTDNGEWVEGYLWDVSRTNPSIAIIFNPVKVEFYEVSVETVGQYTGVKDKNRKKIFEGDVVYSAGDDENAEIKYDIDSARFIIEFYGALSTFDDYYSSELEVIGNIHDNPELLESED